MNFFEKIIYLMKLTMVEPTAFGWFHWMWIFITGLMIFILYKIRYKYNEKQLKWVIGVYGIVAFLLELAKQISWSFNYDSITGIIIWDYEWYSFPFQLCTTPIFVCLICLFLNKNRIRTALFSYIAFTTIWGSIMTIFMPDTCLIDEILINIHTMWMHCGSLVISIYLLITKEVELNIKNLKGAIMVFIVFVVIAQFLNIGIYNLNILNGETFDMFYISPYFETTLPVFSAFRQIFPYAIYFLLYILILSLGTCIIYLISKLVCKIKDK